MSWQVTVLVTPIVLAVVVTSFLAGYATLRFGAGDRDRIVGIFLSIAIATLAWAGFSGLKLLHTDPETKLLFYRLLHVGAAVLPPLFFLFVVAYTDRRRWLRPAVVGGVFFLPGVFVALLFLDPGSVIVAGTERITNDLVIVRVDDGPGFLVFLFYSVVLSAAALTLLLLETRQVGSTYYPQAALITIAVTVPIVFGLLTAVGVPPFTDDRMNLVPTSAAVSALALGFLLFRYRLFDLPPLAHATAMKYSPDGLLVLDRDERIVHANDRGKELLDDLAITPRATMSTVIPGFEPEDASEALFEFETEPNETSYYRSFVEPLSRGGRRVGWVVVLRDETEQQRQQAQLQRRNEQLDRFAETLSHDLRNPLNVAQGYLRAVQKEIDRDALDDRDALEKIHGAHVRMDEIIEELLRLARTGKEIDEVEPVALDALVERAWNTVETDAAELSMETEGMVMADPTTLRQAFENLFRNAVEHGGGDVHVTVGDLDDGFFIEDDGPGIPERDRETAFVVGYSTSPEGTGLGLQIVRSIVEGHGWEITITDGNDGGARFEITGVDRVDR